MKRLPFRFKLLSWEKSGVLLGPITYHYTIIISYEECLALLFTTSVISFNFSALNLESQNLGAAKYHRNSR